MISLKRIPHSDKVLFPKSGITKGGLIAYYEAIATYILPYLKNRPLTLHRFPDGIDKKGFFQKNASIYFPDWIQREKIKKQGGWVNHVICNQKDTLIYLAGQGTITLHITLSTLDKLDYPDKLIFDLDPPNGSFDTVIDGAQALRSLLETELGLTSYPMLTGSSGIHLVIPLDRSENFDGVRSFAKKVVHYLAKIRPKDFTVDMRKDERKGRLFLDYLRNSYAQTAVCPFSVRALENAPVAAPISWEELGKGIKSAQKYTIRSILDRLAHTPNAWKDFGEKHYCLDNAKKKLEHLSMTTVDTDIAFKANFKNI